MVGPKAKEYRIGGLRPTPGRLQTLTVGWHGAVMVIQQTLRQGDDVFRFGVEQTDGANVKAHFGFTEGSIFAACR